MSNEMARTSRTGLPADQGEEGSVVRVKDVIKTQAHDVRGGAALIGFSCDEGVNRNFGRVGAAKGPKAIRDVLFRFPVHTPTEIYEEGDVDCHDGNLEDSQKQLADRVAHLLDRGTRPIVLGGGHEVAFGSFLGLANHLGDAFKTTKVLIVNFDAHFDLRLASRASSGTPFRQISELCSARGAAFKYVCYGISRTANTTALFERADMLGVGYTLDEDFQRGVFEEIRNDLRQRLSEADRVYLTIDLDVLPQYIAPGVSAPAARGIPLDALEALVGDVRASGKLLLADIAELNPEFDRDLQTARIAALLAYGLFDLTTANPSR